MSELIRKPAVAGQFYEGRETSLKQMIEQCFLDDRGPNTLPKISLGNKKLIGIVVPHAGYIFSGAIAAHSYKILADNGFAEDFIILGPNHRGMGSSISVMTEGSWLTPLGKVPINNKIAEEINTGIIEKDENAHLYEHSIEVQLPFLQYISKKKNFSFVPICMAIQDYNTSKEIGKILANVINEIDQRIVMIASTDFSHVGFDYMSMPPEGMRVDEYAKKQDKLAIEKILKMDPKGLIETVHEKNISMCGYGPVAVMLTSAKILGANKVELLKYGSSYEVQPSTSCVGYGAIAVY